MRYLGPLERLILFWIISAYESVVASQPLLRHMRNFFFFFFSLYHNAITTIIYYIVSILLLFLFVVGAEKCLLGDGGEERNPRPTDPLQHGRGDLGGRRRWGTLISLGCFFFPPWNEIFFPFMFFFIFSQLWNEILFIRRRRETMTIADYRTDSP